MRILHSNRSRLSRLMLLFVLVLGLFLAGWLGADPVASDASRTAERPPPPLDGWYPQSDDRWQDQFWLDVHLAKACEAVEWVCKTKFASRPVVRAVSQREMPFYIGQFVVRFDQIHICRANMARQVAEGDSRTLLTSEGLRLLLVHEAAHALDQERFPLEYNGRKRDDARVVCDAVREGHAQHVTRRVAAMWGLGHAFRAFRRMLECPRYPDTTSWHYRAYIQGQDFMDEVYFWGGRPAVDATLQRPPEAIEDFASPQRWLVHMEERDDLR